MKAYAAQMKRVLMSLGVAVLALIGLAAPLIQFSDDADPTVDPVTISDYRADYRIAHDGELTARESISTLFPRRAMESSVSGTSPTPPIPMFATSPTPSR